MGRAAVARIIVAATEMAFHSHPGACLDGICFDRFGVEGTKLFCHIDEPGQIINHPVIPLLCFDLIISFYITRLHSQEIDIPGGETLSRR
jgi:hypothetical protein